MNEHKPSADQSDYKALAQWLQELLAPQPPQMSSPEDEPMDYHPHFYQQLPNFVMALLNKDPQARLHYAPLLYHLVACPSCHTAYRDLYLALQAATRPDPHSARYVGSATTYAPNYPIQPSVSQQLPTLEATPARMVVELSQSFIKQAEAVLHQARHDDSDAEVFARSLLQQAIRISAHITQSGMRSRALQDLVRVATLVDGSSIPASQEPAAYSYAPVITSGTRHGKTMRRAETTLRPAETSAEHQAIYLQAKHLEGSITQYEDTLELHLHGLDKTLRGKYLIISIPLGGLIEPIRWRGGNPHTIRSTTPVDDQGSLSIPLGQTQLQLNNSEERNLLEAIFMLLEVRPAD